MLLVSDLALNRENTCFPESLLLPLAQRARCARERGAQRFWGPLEGKKVLRALSMRATRVLRVGP